MYLKSIIDDIGSLANDTTLKSGGANQDRTKAWVREVYFNEILSKRTDWWFLRKQGTIQTVSAIEGGTVTLTEEGTSLTGSGTAFSSSYNEYVISVAGSAQRVTSFSDTTTGVLENAWENSSQSGATYKLALDRYDLPRWLDSKNIAEIKLQGAREPLKFLSPHQFDNLTSSHSEVSSPKYYSLESVRRDTYTTGTIAGTSGTKILVGSSTSWLSSGLEQFDVVQVGDNVYTIDSIDGDGQITTFENLVEEIASSTSYVGVMDRQRIRLYPFPDKLKTLQVRGITKVAPLNDLSDIPKIPEEYHSVLVKGGFVKALHHNQDPNLQIAMQEYQLALRDLLARNNRDNQTTDSWWG